MPTAQPAFAPVYTQPTQPVQPSQEDLAAWSMYQYMREPIAIYADDAATEPTTESTTEPATEPAKGGPHWQQEPLYVNPAWRQWFGAQSMCSLQEACGQEVPTGWASTDSCAITRQDRFGGRRIRTITFHLRKIPVQVYPQKHQNHHTHHQQHVILVQGEDQTYAAEKAAILQAYAEIIEENNRRISRQRQKVTDLLNHMQQAVFAVDELGTIIEPVSHHSTILFGCEQMAGKSVFDVVYRDYGADSETVMRIKSVLLACIGADEIQWDLLRDDLPAEIKRTVAGQQQTLCVDYVPLWEKRQREYGEEQTLRGMMLVIQDVTKLEKLTREVARAQAQGAEKMHLLQEIVDAVDQDASGIQQFFTHATRLWQECSLYTDTLTENPEYVHPLFRIVHTLKGNARVFRLAVLTTSLHQFEQSIVHIRDALRTGQAATGHTPNWAQEVQQVQEQFLQSEARLQAYQQIAEKILRLAHPNFAADPPTNSHANSHANSHTNPHTNPQGHAQEYTNAGQMQTFLEKVVLDVGHTIGKPACLQFVGADTPIKTTDAAVLQDAMMHMVRNSMDHGIEAASTRAALGKDPLATIEVGITREKVQNGWIYHAYVQDDGRGIDAAKLVQKAIESGYISPEQAARLDEQQKYRLMFMAGLSTAAEVTQISGRGVGMDVVYSAIQGLGGKIHISSQPQAGTRIGWEWGAARSA